MECGKVVSGESTSPGVVSSSGQTQLYIHRLPEQHGTHKQLQIHHNLLCHAVA